MIFKVRAFDIVGVFEIILFLHPLDPSIRWLEFVDELVFVRGNFQDLRERYKHDGTHLNPVYVELLERSLNKCLDSA